MAAKPPSKSFFDYARREAVKIATSNLFIESEKASEDFMTNMIFEEIGGNELIDTQNYNFLVNPEKSNISNISTILEVTSPKSLFKSSNIYDATFNQFEIELANRIPSVGNDFNNGNVYFSTSLKSIIIEFVNLADDEEIEVQFVSTSLPISDTI